ncbi:MAG: hypothetical protein ABIH41_02005 [Nanoarchaeota archaeon]
MDEPELDAWFLERKSNLLEQYKASLVDKVDFTKERARFEAKMKRLLDQYQKKYDRMVRSERLRKRLRDPVDKISSGLDSVTDLFEERT